MGNEASTHDAFSKRTGLVLDATEGFGTTIRAPLSESSLSAELPRLSLIEDELAGPPAAGHLRVREHLGRGGLGDAHAADQPLLKRSVAIKRPLPTAGPGAAQSLYREARVMGSLEHPNIVPVHALGADSYGRPVLVMKRIEGVEWLKLLEDPNHPGWAWWTGLEADPLVRNIELLISVCRPIAFAHSHGILHGDLKPANVMLSSDGGVYLLDWGIATQLDGAVPHPISGTPCYMAPEMVDPMQPLTAATDVYLIGGCLHTVLTGRPPHDGRSLRDVLMSALGEVPTPSGEAIPSSLAMLCSKALSREPTARFHSVAELIDALKGWLRTRGSSELVRVARTRHAVFRERAALAQPDPVGVARAFAEARFGYRRALDEWTDNDEAKTELRSVLVEMAHYELARENVDHARSLVAELAEDDPARQELSASVAKAAERLKALHALEHAGDLRVARAQRTAVMAVLTLFILIWTATLWWINPSIDGLPPSTFVLQGLLVTAAIWISVLVSRRSLFSNRINRGIALALCWSSGLLFIARLYAYYRHQQARDVLFADTLVLSGTIAGVAPWVKGPLWICALIMIAGGAGLLAAPQLAIPIYGGVNALVLGLAGYGWWRGVGEDTPTDAS